VDQNKVKKLRDVGYQILPTCARCKFGKFATPSKFFGECNKFTYEHLKHHKNPRQLSVNAAGTCSSFEGHPLENLGKWGEFVTKKLPIARTQRELPK